MRKLYVVRLTDEERQILVNVTEKLKGSPQKVKRANIMLKADLASNWTDKKIAEAFSCRSITVENVRKMLVTEGFDRALNGKKREDPVLGYPSGRQWRVCCLHGKRPRNLCPPL